MSAFSMRFYLLLMIALPVFADTASIQIFTEAEDGKAIAPAQVKLVQVGSQTDYGSKFQGGLVRHIPFGIYNMEVFVSGFSKYEQRLSVSRPHVTVRAIMSISTGEQHGPLSLKGNVLLSVGSEADNATWILAFPLVGSPGNIIQSLVGTDGQFLLETTDSGPYLLVVMQAKNVLDCQKIYIGFDSPPLTIKPGAHGCGPQ